ncbi:MAG TPA: winged helix-turn-helix transcriptional regulator [Candidatus Nitrosocosmicus sp.]|nr:winged helix-turn-helix transcriptional regulator [Candidatus Nitrosocosmicus sp.]
MPGRLNSSADGKISKFIHQSNGDHGDKSKKNSDRKRKIEKGLKDDKVSTLTLDTINLGIVEALVNNGDIKSAEIAAKLKIPLSTIQRRRSNLEKNMILKKNYTLDLKKLGLRVSEISVATRKGESQNVMNDFYNKHKKYIVDMALRIGNPDTNLSFRIAHTDSNELFSLLEEIKGMDMVSMVQWSEYIMEKKNSTLSLSDLVSK